MGDVDPGHLCAGVDGGCAVDEDIDNCVYYGTDGTAYKYDLFVRLDCEFAPRQPPSPPATLPRPPPPPKPPALPLCEPTQCDAGEVCGMCLQLVDSTECPDGVHAIAMLDCEAGEPINIGDLCVATDDADCGTDVSADNCLYEVQPYVYQSWDVYRRVSCTFSPSLPPPSLPPWPRPPPSAPSPPSAPHPPYAPFNWTGGAGGVDAGIGADAGGFDRAMLIGLAVGLIVLVLVLVCVLVRVCKRLKARRPKVLLSSHPTVVNAGAGVQLDDFDVVGMTTRPGVVDVGGAAAAGSKGGAAAAGGVVASGGGKAEKPAKERKVAKKPLIKSAMETSAVAADSSSV